MFSLAPNAPTATNYDVYDAEASSPARYFMVHKKEAGWNPLLARQLMVRRAKTPEGARNPRQGLLLGSSGCQE